MPVSERPRGDDGAHPSSDRLAEYLDRVLSPEDTADTERHLAVCADCRSVVIDAAAFLDSSDAQVITPPTAEAAPPISVPRRRGWALPLVGGLAAAAALMLAVTYAAPDVIERWFGDVPERTALQHLHAALAAQPARPIDARLTGLTYAPPPVDARGAERAEVVPEVRIAAAELEQDANAQRTPATLWAAGIGFLVTRQLDDAIRALEAAAESDAQNATLHSDLAAAYLTRGKRNGDSDDFSRALAAANHALELRAKLPEGLFNRALALEALRSDAAPGAWQDVIASDAGSPWAIEASRRSAARR